MKKLIIGFIILLFAVWVGFLIHQDPGYVLISYANHAVETSLWVAFIGLVITFLFIYLFVRVFKHTSKLGSKIQRWNQERDERKSIKLTNAGLCELAEGNWKLAENKLIKAAKLSTSPLINYLGAARAAQAQEAYERRDNYLRDAHHTNRDAEVAIVLTQAQLQMSAKQWEQALATLRHLNEIVPNHKYALRLLKDAYLECNDWQQLQLLLPSLRKRKALSESELESLERHTYSTLLRKANTSEQLEKIWNDIPRHLQSNTSLVQLYTELLIKQNESQRATKVIETTLKKQWDSKLVSHYGLTNGMSNPSQLSKAESWLSKHPNDPELLLCLGRLALREQFWGKAREYLERVVRVKPTSAAHQELGRALEALGETEAALTHYRTGLTMQSP